MVLIGHPEQPLPPKHTHSDAPVSLLLFNPHSTHTPETEYVPDLHADATSPPSHPKPNGHPAHTRSPVASHFLTRRKPGLHLDSHPLHSFAPLADQVPSLHSCFLLLKHSNPGSHGQHVVTFGGSRPYSPGGQNNSDAAVAVAVAVAVEKRHINQKCCCCFCEWLWWFNNNIS